MLKVNIKEVPNAKKQPGTSQQASQPAEEKSGQFSLLFV